VSSFHVWFVHSARDISSTFEEIVRIFEHSGLPIISWILSMSFRFQVICTNVQIFYICAKYTSKREREREREREVSLNVLMNNHQSTFNHLRS